MITILFSCRVKGNPDSGLMKFLESLRRCSDPMMTLAHPMMSSINSTD
jgi:hypothetical protein